jgi:hypothetical protein
MTGGMYVMLGGALDLVATLALLGFLCESMVQYIFSPFKKIEPYLMYVSLGMGVFLAIAFNVNLIAAVVPGIPGTVLAYWTGVVLTGLIIGRGANFVHDLWEKFITVQKPE